MKLSNKQSCETIRYLITNKLLGDLNTTWPITDALNILGELFDGDIKEARVIFRYGMAGKIWNDGNEIYITGHSQGEIPAYEYKRERNEIESANSNIAHIIKDYSDNLPKVTYAISNDGGKTAVACRDNLGEAFEYLDAQNKGGLSDYSVVVIRK